MLQPNTKAHAKRRFTIRVLIEAARAKQPIRNIVVPPSRIATHWIAVIGECASSPGHSCVMSFRGDFFVPCGAPTPRFSSCHVGQPQRKSARTHRGRRSLFTDLRLHLAIASTILACSDGRTIDRGAASASITAAKPTPSSAGSALAVPSAVSTEQSPSAAPATTEQRPTDAGICRDLVPGKLPETSPTLKHPPPSEYSLRARGFDTSTRAPWATLTRAGFSFAYVQAALGPRPNETFEENWAASKACGIPRGAYQFVSPSDDGRALARVLAKTLGHDTGELPPTLDLEQPNSCADDCCNQSCTEWTIRVSGWVSEIERLTSRKAVLYVVEPFYSRCLCGATTWSDHALWLAAWPRFDFPPRPRIGGFDAWTMYQYEGNVIAYGGVIDLDLFLGDSAALASAIRESAPR
jgi:lysozyme